MILHQRNQILPKIDMADDFIQPPDSPKFSDRKQSSYDDLTGSIPNFESFIGASLTLEAYTPMAVAEPRGVDQVDTPSEEVFQVSFFFCFLFF